MNSVPCYQCEDRNAECHSKCTKYREWKTEQDILRKNRNRQKELNMNYVDYVLCQREKFSRAKSGRTCRKIVSQI